MKKFSKILSVALLVALVLSLGVANAFAEGEGFNITVTSTTGGDRSYVAYQVFAGDLSADGKTLSNITWGKGVNKTTILGALQGSTNAALLGDDPLTDDTETDVNIFTSCTSAADVAEVLGTLKSGKDAIAEVAKIFGDNLGTPETALTGLDAGYYLIVEDTDEGDIPEGATYSKFMLEVVNDVNVTAKDTTTTTEKKVKDINDTDSANYDGIEWADSADHDIGDMIPFQLKATIANDYAEYNEYFFAFHDEQSAGLTFKPDTVKVFVDGNEITTGFKVVTAAAEIEDACTFEVVFEDLKDITAVHAGSVITVEYESELNENAVIGSQGNTNKMFGEFSNNPNDNQHGKTTKDTVIVFTYKPVIDKIDGQTQTPLEGAGFTLYKEVKNTSGAQTGAAIKAALKNQNASIEATALKDDAYYVTKLMTKVAESETSFEFKGIDDGTYVLVETTIPDGYNAFKSVEVKVTASHTDDNAQAPAVPLTLTSLSATGGFTAEEGTETGTFSGVIDTDIENNKGAQLPSTGGIGTTIFYVVGGVLVLAAIILLVTKKRMSD